MQLQPCKLSLGSDGSPDETSCRRPLGQRDRLGASRPGGYIDYRPTREGSSGNRGSQAAPSGCDKKRSSTGTRPQQPPKPHIRTDACT